MLRELELQQGNGPWANTYFLKYTGDRGRIVAVQKLEYIEALRQLTEDYNALLRLSEFVER